MPSNRSGSVLLIGGARSGKSRAGQAMAEVAPGPVTMVVTAVAFDDEMVDRIARHQADRPADWTTVEAPRDLLTALQGIDETHTLLLDCLTLWISNLVLADVPATEIESTADQIGAVLAARSGPTIVISNEVGHGIVPGDPLSRAFRDVHGRVNQHLAGHLDQTYLVIAGRLLPTLDPTELEGFT